MVFTHSTRLDFPKSQSGAEGLEDSWRAAGFSQWVGGVGVSPGFTSGVGAGARRDLPRMCYQVLGSSLGSASFVLVGVRESSALLPVHWRVWGGAH